MSQCVRSPTASLESQESGEDATISLLNRWRSARSGSLASWSSAEDDAHMPSAREGMLNRGSFGRLSVPGRSVTPFMRLSAERSSSPLRQKRRPSGALGAPREGLSIRRVASAFVDPAPSPAEGSGSDAVQDIHSVPAGLYGGFVDAWAFVQIMRFNEGMLEYRARQYFDALAKASFSGVAFSSAGMKGLVVRPAFHISIITFSVLCLLGSDLPTLWSRSIILATQLRFVRDEARNPAMCDVIGPGVAKLGVYLEDDMVDVSTAEVRVYNNTMHYTFGAPLKMNSYSFFLSDTGPEDCDPIEWSAYAFSDATKDWVEIPDDPYLKIDRVLPTKRGAKVFIDARPRPSMYADALCAISTIFCFFGCVISARNQWMLGPLRADLVLWTLPGVLNLMLNQISALLLARTYSESERFCMEQLCVIQWLPIAFWGEQFMFFFAIGGFSWMVIGVYLVYKFDFYAELIMGFITSFFCVWIHLDRWLMQRNANKLMLSTKGDYDQAWNRLRTDEPQVLREMSAFVDHMKSECETSLPRHYSTYTLVAFTESSSEEQSAELQRLLSSKTHNGKLHRLLCDRSSSHTHNTSSHAHGASSHAHGASSHPHGASSHAHGAVGNGTHFLGPPSTSDAKISSSSTDVLFQEDLDRSAPVTSLSKLYIQAAALHGLLCRKTLEWAMASGGHLSECISDAQKGPSLVQVTPNDSEGGWMERVEWAGLKHCDRSIEKMFRVYKGDCSRIVDISRQSIVFATCQDMITCLKYINSDPDVAIERVKSSLDPDQPGNEYNGYRDIKLNIRIVHEEALKMLVHSHVCEIQLIPRRLYDTKSDRGHTIYRQWRNTLCE
eukprot:CAMPEP_0206277052 /NCGR_PEP_ID=MMETSP0047_2-20121206/36652_1 /ASSEMBLY_ACC=CAM_ASM_000192 /TAXON_ID=195065 /ORGANISM="Chroomonas mesostigmatica_cf, Strain CCMP1168" /LENGTH=836 /DNA_ID=CAMNT_0053706647 /DNA_START=81 /DNA_END=2591 /DNA_ORIENTATION=+